MTSLMISNRLQAIARYCPEGARVADIGSDHALLASYLLVNGIASYVIAGELNEGPYQAALRQIETIQTQQRASVRKGDGLAVLSPGEADIICIAGMGGQLIVSILEAGKDKLTGVSRLVLQPNVGEDNVRRWLIENNWQLIDETIIEEDQIIYEILVAVRGEPLLPYINQERTVDELIRIGPFLWREKAPVLLQKWQRECNKWKQILTQVKQSNRPETVDRVKEIEVELVWIDEVIRCLHTDKQ